MDQGQSTNSTEQRRKLLKGALGASTVLGMGYSSAALASFECVEKARINGGYPLGNLQFTRTDPRSASVSKGWAWQPVQIYRYLAKNNGGNCPSSSNGSVEAFDLNGSLYRINSDNSLTQLGLTSGFCRYTTFTSNGTTTTYPQSGWVLAYFTDGGEPAGSYPTYTTGTIGHTPATESCLNSINAGVVARYIFGG